ncbi:MAG: membrane dipeptidase [Pseudomonadota bacterium]
MKNHNTLLSRRRFLQAGATLAFASADASPQTSLLQRKYRINGNMVIPPFVGDPLTDELKTQFHQTGLTAFKLSLGGSNGNYEQCLEILRSLPQIYQANPDTFMHINSLRDLERAYDDDKIGIIYSFETATMFDDKVERIQEFANLGVRIMQPGYNNSNAFGAGVLSKSKPFGLTKLGKQAIETMQDNHVLVDLSHAHEETANDILNMARRPVAITHAGCNAVNDHPRNKSDSVLKRVADSGGVVGIYEMSYLTPDLDQQSLDAFMQHVMHAVKVCGEDHVGIGSDTPILGFDTSAESLAEWDEINHIRKETGVAAPGEGPPPYVVGMNGPHKMDVFADELRARGLSDRAVNKILGINFSRVFQDAWA